MSTLFHKKREKKDKKDKRKKKKNKEKIEKLQTFDLSYFVGKFFLVMMVFKISFLF